MPRIADFGIRSCLQILANNPTLAFNEHYRQTLTVSVVKSKKNDVHVLTQTLILRL